MHVHNSCYSKHCCGISMALDFLEVSNPRAGLTMDQEVTVTGWTAADMPDQTGKVAIVTGSNTGIGFHTAQALAGAGADVVVAARDPEKGEAAVAKIVEAHPSARVQFSQLDLASLSSVA